MVLTSALLFLTAGAEAGERKPGRLDRFKAGLQQKVELIKDACAALSPISKRGPTPSEEKAEFYKQRKLAAKPGALGRALNHILQIRSAACTGLPDDIGTETFQAQAPLVLRYAASQSPRPSVKALYHHAARVAARQIGNDPKLRAEATGTMKRKWLEVSRLENLKKAIFDSRGNTRSWAICCVIPGSCSFRLVPPVLQLQGSFPYFHGSYVAARFRADRAGWRPGGGRVATG
jgi:hypothetical protein